MNDKKLPNAELWQFLRYHRTRNHLSVSEFCQEMKSRFGITIAEKTVYGWESGAANPPVQTFIRICELYEETDISMLYTADSTADPVILSPLEKQVVRNFRKCESFRSAILFMLQIPDR